jgi:predicted transcriptional regulator
MRRVKTSIYLDADDLKKLKVLAEKRDTTLARLFRKAIKQLLKEKA